jgi:hypothetical protein
MPRPRAAHPPQPARAKGSHALATLTLALATLALALAAGGCGGGGGASTRLAKAPGDSPPPMIAQANAICARLNRQFEADRPASTAIGEIARVAPRRAALEVQTVSVLEKLTAPAALAHGWQQILADRQTLAHELAQLGQAAKAGSTRLIHTLAGLKDRVHEELRALAVRDDLGQCAKTS